MLTVEEALERILSHFETLDTVRVPLLDALGQVLAEDAVATHDIPPLDNSAMDGYAVQAADMSGASEDSPSILRVVGYVAAGQLPRETVTPGTAVRIMTGAPIPDGADAVVPFEETDETDRRESGDSMDEIGVLVPVAGGADIRPAGQDVRAGTTVLPASATLRPAEIGVLASLGFDTVSVVRRPVVAILSTGDELLNPGDEYDEGKIYDANSYSVAASVRRYGGVPKLLGIARDNMDSVNAKLREGMEADMLITSAGVSKGDYDMVKDALAQRGAHRLLVGPDASGQAAGFRRSARRRRQVGTASRSAGQPGQRDGGVRAVRARGDSQDDGQDASAEARSPRDAGRADIQYRRASRVRARGDSQRERRVSRQADRQSKLEPANFDVRRQRVGGLSRGPADEGRGRDGGSADAGLAGGGILTTETIMNADAEEAPAYAPHHIDADVAEASRPVAVGAHLPPTVLYVPAGLRGERGDSAGPAGFHGPDSRSLRRAAGFFCCPIRR